MVRQLLYSWTAWKALIVVVFWLFISEINGSYFKLLSRLLDALYSVNSNCREKLGRFINKIKKKIARWSFHLWPVCLIEITVMGYVLLYNKLWYIINSDRNLRKRKVIGVRLIMPQFRGFVSLSHFDYRSYDCLIQAK